MNSEPPAEEREPVADDPYQDLATLAGGLAHEIKNPLSTIRLNLELLTEDLSEGDTPRERRATAKIMTLQRECQRLQNVLDDFLRFIKVGNLDLTLGDLNREVERTIDFFKPQADDAGVDLVRYLDPNLPPVMLNSEALHGALLNLLLNAQQAMPRGGQIVVRSQAVEDGVELDLIDTGCGMDERVQGQIFQAFYSTKPGGTGLGIPTTHRVMEAHHGKIRVQSAQGRGTRFTLWFPKPNTETPE